MASLRVLGHAFRAWRPAQRYTHLFDRWTAMQDWRHQRRTWQITRTVMHTLYQLTTVNMDFIPHYRPLTNVVRRPTQKGGKGYSLIGHHEIMLPLLVAAVAEELGSQGA